MRGADAAQPLRAFPVFAQAAREYDLPMGGDAR
jgi:hypothetical protein